MNRLSLLSILLCTLCAVLVSAQLDDCHYEMKSPSVNYDLNGLRGRTFVRETIDVLEDYDITFALCHNFFAPPVTNPLGVCNKTGVAVGAAYQLKNKTDESVYTVASCKMIGRADAGNMKWEPLDSVEPEVGIRHVYTNGEQCGVDKTRTFIVNLKCVDTCAEPKISAIYEDPMCNYTATIETCYACPTECLRTQDQKMCNGHGLCNVDVDANRARCYCNTGWEGSHCQQKVGSAPSESDSHTTTVLLVIVILLGVALLVVGYFLIHKMRKLNADDGRYSQLAADSTEANDRAMKQLANASADTSAISSASTNSTIPTPATVIPSNLNTTNSSNSTADMGIAPVPTTQSGVFSLNS